jgi:hypothetical protein
MDCDLIWTDLNLKGHVYVPFDVVQQVGFGVFRQERHLVRGSFFDI